MGLVAVPSIHAQSATSDRTPVGSASALSSEELHDVQVGDHIDALGEPTTLHGMDAVELSALPVLDESGTVIRESLSDVSPDALGDQKVAGTQFRLTKRPGQKRGLSRRRLFGACMPVTGGDNPHESTETGGTKNQVSAHGWWRKGECSGTKATVKACLHELWVADNGTKHWIQKKCNSKEIKPAKKNTNKPRMNVRANCSNLKLTGWANYVDVDVHGTWDNSLKLAKYRNVYCRIL